jgi:flagellar biosynthetic protein FliP
MTITVTRKGTGPALIKAPVAKRSPWGKILLVVLAIAFALIVAHPALAQTASAAAPAAAAPIAAPATPGAGDAVDHALGDLGGGKAPLALSLQILIIMGLLTILPGILLMMTSFTRIIIVLSIVRQALGLQNSPPNQVLIGLSLFLSFFVMAPVITQINTTAIQPYAAGTMPATEMIKTAAVPLHSFMAKQTRKADITLFAGLAKSGPYAKADDIPFSVLLPAFVTSELKTAFQIGFAVFIPFLIIDMLVASVLMSMGMMMVSPVLISLPFKIMLFVLVDGWNLLIGSLAQSFGV